MRKGNLSTFLAALGVLVLIICCAAWPRHHDQVNNRMEVDGYADSRRVCVEEMVPTLVDQPQTARFTGVAVTQLLGVYRVIGKVSAEDYKWGGRDEHTFVCAVVLKNNTTWVAKELRLIEEY